MRYESQITALSWIPSEAIGGLLRAPFELGVTHYDEPPPDVVGSSMVELEELGAADRFRFANVLRAWVDVGDDDRIIGCGYMGCGLIGSTEVRMAGLHHTFSACRLPDIQHRPLVADDGRSACFVQTCGGRTGLPAPRRVRRKPFVQWDAPLAWTTLSLTLHHDGTCAFDLVGASRFPRHWIYDESGQLARKSGMTDFKHWYRRSFGRHSPWGDEDSAAMVTAVETALERSLSAQIMHGTKPKIRKLRAGETLTRQGDAGDELYLVLDGVIRVECDGERLHECGPGALLGERAGLQGGRRTSTLVAVTPCRVATTTASGFGLATLEELSMGHRREFEPGTAPRVEPTSRST